MNSENDKNEQNSHINKNSKPNQINKATKHLKSEPNVMTLESKHQTKGPVSSQHDPIIPSSPSAKARRSSNIELESYNSMSPSKNVPPRRTNSSDPSKASQEVKFFVINHLRKTNNRKSLTPKDLEIKPYARSQRRHQSSEDSNKNKP